MEGNFKVLSSLGSDDMEISLAAELLRLGHSEDYKPGSLQTAPPGLVDNSSCARGGIVHVTVETY